MKLACSRALRCRRLFCTQDKPPAGLFDAIDEDMLREEEKQNARVLSQMRRVKRSTDTALQEDMKTLKKDWEGWREKRRSELSGGPDFTSLRGRATVRGTQNFFEDRNIGVDKPWVRRLPQTGLHVSALSLATKRLSDKNDFHKAALQTAFKAGVNLFDIPANDTVAIRTFSETFATEALNNSSISRSNVVVVLRVGFVTFSDFVTLNYVAPDFESIPTSRDLCTFGPDIDTPANPPPSHISLNKRKAETAATPHDPDGLGDSLMRRFQHFLPDQPKLDLSKLSDGALLKLTGMVRLNRKLSHHWSGAPPVLEAQIEHFLESGVDFIDYVLLESAHLVHKVVSTKEEAVTYLCETFSYFEKLVRAKKIGWYGIESKKLFGGSGTHEHLDMRWVLEAAERAGGKDHHFKMVSLPFNLTEREVLFTKMADDHPKTVFDFLKEQDLACITSRPLSTYDREGREQRYVDHSRFKDPGFPRSLAVAFEDTIGLEEENDRLLHNVILRPAPELYHFGRSLAAGQHYLDNYYLFDDYVTIRYDAMMDSCLDSLRENKDTLLNNWVSRYVKAYDTLKRAYRIMLQHMHAVRDEKIKAGIESCLGHEKLGDELSQVAVNAVLATNVMQSVSVGMRNPVYVDTLISRNYYMLRNRPVALLGRLFTEPEVSFLERRPDKKLVITGTATSISGKTEEELQKEAVECKRMTGLGTKLIVLDTENPEDLPEWAKLVDPKEEQTRTK